MIAIATSTIVFLVTMPNRGICKNTEHTEYINTMGTSGKAKIIARGIRSSLCITKDVLEMETKYIRGRPMYETTYSTTPALLVESTCTVPLDVMFPDALPAMLRMRPSVMRSWVILECLTVDGPLDSALMEPTLYSLALICCVEMVEFGAFWSTQYLAILM
jgi:hypothetical protein